MTLTVSTSEGAAVTSFEAPLELTFPNAPADMVPAYSHDGTTWTAMPELTSDSLPAGFHDGWFRDSEGTVHILTLHATYFGLLQATAHTQAELTAQVRVPNRVSARARAGLAVAIRPSLPGRLHLVLRGKGSRVVAEKVVQVKAGRDLVRLAWGKKRVPAGRYLLTVVLQAGRSTFVQRNVVTVSR